jgi:hypothetical protein
MLESKLLPWHGLFNHVLLPCHISPSHMLQVHYCPRALALASLLPEVFFSNIHTFVPTCHLSETFTQRAASKASHSQLPPLNHNLYPQNVVLAPFLYFSAKHFPLPGLAHLLTCYFGVF